MGAARGPAAPATKLVTCLIQAVIVEVRQDEDRMNMAHFIRV